MKKMSFSSYSLLLIIMLGVSCSENNSKDETEDGKNELSKISIILEAGKNAAGDHLNCAVLSCKDSRLPIKLYTWDNKNQHLLNVSEISKTFPDAILNNEGYITMTLDIYQANLNGSATTLEIITSSNDGAVKRYRKENPITEIKSGKTYNITITNNDMVTHQPAVISNKYTFKNAGSVKMVDPRDGKEYNIIAISNNGQNYCWMTDNLNVGITCKEDNDELKYIFKNYYDDNNQNGTKYGGLYELYEALRRDYSTNKQPSYKYPVQGICPEGWHIPSDQEWTSITPAIQKLNLTLSGFKVYLGSPEFQNLNYEGAWWSSTLHETDQHYGYSRHFAVDGEEIKFERIANHMNYGYSIRCVLDY